MRDKLLRTANAKHLVSGDSVMKQCLMTGQLIPFLKTLINSPSSTYDVQEEVDVGPFVHKEAYRVPINGHLEHKVWGRSWLDHLPNNSIVV